MNRFAPHLGMMFLLFVAALFGWLGSLLPQKPSPSAPAPDFHVFSSVATETPPVLSFPPTFAGAVSSSTEPKRSAPRPSKEKISARAPAKVSAQPTHASATAAPAPAPPASSSPLFKTETVDALRSALVNIVCYAPLGSGLHSISASGVIVTPRGMILTNAHVGQYFLFADRGVSCRIRTGDPARDAYAAALAYVPEAWVRANADILTKSLPSGTGEHDFALLAITQSLTATPLPQSFPFVAPAVSAPSADTPLIIGTYGAQFLESSQIQSYLFPTLVFGSVKEVFTFATDTPDVLALGGSAAAQEGSSGGAVMNDAGELTGIITTSTVSGPTSSRSLNAITLSYIRRDYAAQTGTPIDPLFLEDSTRAVADFSIRMPALEEILAASLPAN